MNPTTLYLDLSSQDDTHHHAALVAEDGRLLAKHPFEYRIDTITILTELEQFDLTRGNRAERMEWIQAFGEKLYQKVFLKEMHTVLQQTLRDAEWLRLVVRLDKDAKRLAQVPWEFLHDGNGFLVADEKMSLFRCPSYIASQPLKSLEDDKLRILCLVSSPLDLEEHERLAVEYEQERLLQALDSALGAGQIEIEFEDEASLTNLESALDEGRYHILHYTGHGTFNPRVGGSLIMEDDQGKKLHVGWDKLKFVLKKGLARGLRLVLLSGCQTAKTAGNESEAFSDLARPLLQAGIPAVIAMQYAITDEAGMILAETFYRSLACGEPVDNALSDARRRLFLHQNYIVRSDFATPVLFSTNTNCLRCEERKIQVTKAEIGIDRTHQLANLQQLGLGFVGRRKELRQIKQLFLQGNVRAIILHGLGGIGKTVTATQAAYRLQKHFWGVYAFDCSAGILSPDQIVVELHHFLKFNNIDALQEVVYAPIPPVQKATYLAQVLTQVPLLLIFDNMESLLDKETKRTITDHDLAIFLRTLINTTTHGTRFLFTSRYTFRLLEDEQHGDTVPVTAHRLQQAYHAINLNDLSRPEAIQIMNKFPSLSSAGFFLKEEIYAKLGGHPYILNVFAHHCQYKAPEEVLQSLDEVTGEMVHFAMLEMSWDRLSERARALLKRISVFQKAIPLAAIKWVMGEKVEVETKVLSVMRERLRQEAKKDKELSKQIEWMSDKELEWRLSQMLPPQQHRCESVTKEIEELIHWGMIVQLTESEDGNYSIHSLVREFCQRKKDAAAHHNALLDAVEFYLNTAKVLSKNSPSQVFTKLDARQLFFEAKEFEQAGYIVHDVQDLLIRWGFISLVERLLKETFELCKGHRKAVALYSLANIYKGRGEYDNAFKIYQHVYQMFEKMKDQRGMAAVKHQIGMVYQNQGDYKAALREYQSSLKIHEELGDEAKIGINRHQIGTIHIFQGNYEAALREYKISLKIAEKLQDKSEIASIQFQLGRIHQQQGDYKSALRKYKTSLQTHQELGDKARIALARHQIGVIYRLKGENEKALQEYQASLQIKEELGDKAGIVLTRLEIGNIHYERKNYNLALQDYQVGLQIAEKIGDKDNIARLKGQIARIHEKQEKFPEAFAGYLQTFAIFSQLQSPSARPAINDLRRLRGTWGAVEFDAA